MKNYDQWKTASPYDDEVDWAKYGAKCPKCQSEQFEVWGSDAESFELDCLCHDCSFDFIFKIPDNMIFVEDTNYEPLEDFCQPSHYTGPYTRKQCQDILEWEDKYYE